LKGQHYRATLQENECQEDPLAALRACPFRRCPIGPAIEESLFRGVILRGFLQRYTAFTSILLSALLFALIHHNPAQFLGPLCTGILFGAALYRSNSVLPGFIGHAVTNALWFFSNVNSDFAELLAVGNSRDDVALVVARIAIGIFLSAVSVSLLLLPARRKSAKELDEPREGRAATPPGA
jgi:uncharacterized protein